MDAESTEIIATLKGREVFRAVLPPGEYLIGREHEAAIRLRSRNVSRPHALLSLNYRQWIIEDRGSANGTWVAGKRIAEATFVFPNQRLRVGDIDIILKPLLQQQMDQVNDPYSIGVHRLLPSTVLGENRYELGTMLGMGATGVVVEAHDRATRRWVAMKVLLHSGSEESVSRFVAEAQVCSQLEHPNIIPVYDLSVNSLGNPYYTMKLMRGGSLRGALEMMPADGPNDGAGLDLVKLLDCFHKACDAVAFAHSKLIMHRDLKPSNILLDGRGNVFVVDWGLAKAFLSPNAPVGEPGSDQCVDWLRNSDPWAALTASGDAVGTLEYMSPEQAKGSPDVDYRSDIFSLGAILYTILTGRPHVQGSGPLEVLESLLSGKPRSFATTQISELYRRFGAETSMESLIATIKKAMSPDRAQRHPSVIDLQTEVHAAYA